MYDSKPGRLFSNTGKRLLITFCLDVSPSMGKEIGQKRSAIAILNETVDGIVSELAKDKKLQSMVELMFVTFSSDILSVNRTSLNRYTHQTFREEPVGGSNIPQAVLGTFQKIDERVHDYQRAGMRYHSPIFVLISDGNPDYEESDDQERSAMDLVTTRCQRNVSGSVCPFIIGIGDELNESTQSTMSGYAKGFMDGYFHVMGDEALQSRIAKMIVKLFTCSIKYVAQNSDYSLKALDATAGEMNRVQTQISNEIRMFRRTGEAR